MANKRVSELSPITAAEVEDVDLFLLADVDKVESKKLTAAELGGYLQTYVTSSATSSWAINAKTASYLLYQGFVNGTASYALTSSFNISSSHARWADTASYALFALSASYARSSSYALTASYALTSSVQLIFSSAFANHANSASFLIYTGRPNGTASYAILANNANNAKTASFLIGPSGTGAAEGTATYALASTQARTASFLQYSGNANGTASYAMRSNLSVLADGAKTASFLYYNTITPNGTASYSITASNANTASYVQTSSYALLASAVNNVYGTYIKGPITITGAGLNTASFNFHVTTSNWIGTKLIVEVSGDINLPISTSNWIDPETTNRSLRIYMDTTDGGPPSSQQSYKPLSIITDATQSFMKFPLTAKTIFTTIDQRAYQIILYLYGSGSFIDASSFEGFYGDGLYCFLHTNATNIDFV